MSGSAPGYSSRSIFRVRKCDNIFPYQVSESGQLMEDDDDAPMTDECNEMRVVLLVEALFSLASKTFTHLGHAVGKYADVLKLCVQGDLNQRYWLLGALARIFYDKPQALCFVVDRLIRANTIEAAHVAGWIFSDPMKAELIWLYPWEIVDRAIERMIRHVQRLDSELTKARRRLQLSLDKAAAAEEMAEGGAAGPTPITFDAEMGDGDGDPPPTEDMIERMEERHAESVSQQSELFMLIFQRLIIAIGEVKGSSAGVGSGNDELMSDHASRAAASNPFLYSWMCGRLQSILFKYRAVIMNDRDNLQNLLFSKEDADPDIHQIWHQFTLLA